MKCSCGRGYASHFDNLCKFCRENLVPREKAKRVGVRHRGEGMSVDQYKKAMYEREDILAMNDFKDYA